VTQSNSAGECRTPAAKKLKLVCGKRSALKDWSRSASLAAARLTNWRPLARFSITTAFLRPLTLCLSVPLLLLFLLCFPFSPVLLLFLFLILFQSHQLKLSPLSTSAVLLVFWLKHSTAADTCASAHRGKWGQVTPLEKWIKH